MTSCYQHAYGEVPWFNQQPCAVLTSEAFYSVHSRELPDNILFGKCSVAKKACVEACVQRHEGLCGVCDCLCLSVQLETAF